MTFQLSLLLFIYLGFIVVWLIFFMIALFHMLKFGFKNFMTLFMTFIFAGIAVLMVMASSAFISQIDWSSEVTILNGIFNSGLNFN